MKNVKFSEMFKLRVEKMWQSIIGSNSYKPGYYLVCDDESRKIFFRGKLRQVVEMKEFLREVDIDLPQVKI